MESTTSKENLDYQARIHSLPLEDFIRQAEFDDNLMPNNRIQFVMVLERMRPYVEAGLED